MQPKVVRLSAVLLALAFGGGCAKKHLSDRESRREQQRVNAETKRKELAEAAGDFHGTLLIGEERQDVSLRLEIKDVPDTSDGEIDPVLIPTLQGALRLTYGARTDGAAYVFGVDRADFEPASRHLDLVTTNPTLKELVLSVERTDQGLVGRWSSASTSTSGDLELFEGDPLALTPETPAISGAYAGRLVWKDGKRHAAATLSVSTAQDEPDHFSVSGTLRVRLGGGASSEALLYELAAAEFNPLTRQMTLVGNEGAVRFVASLHDGAISGAFYSGSQGEVGRLTLLPGDEPPMAPTGAQAVGALSGTYYGTLEDRNPGTKLPPRLMVNLVAAAAAGAEDGLKVTGSVRLYFGGFDTAEYLELPIESVDHRFYTRRLVLRTGGHPRLTLTASLSKEGTLTGSVSEDTFGEVGPFTVTAAAPQDGGGALGGTYEGWFEWRGLESWQHGSLVLTPTFDGPDAMTLRGTTSLVFGDPTGDERLVYAAVDAAFDAATGQAVFGDQDAEVTLRGSLGDGMFEGEWTTARTGEMGRFRLKLGGGLPPPSGLGLLTSLEGKFQGSLVNTSPDANLPERVMLGFVTSPDLTAPSGLKVEGSLRLYLGPFGSNEYTELPLTEIQYDVFNRKLSARTTGDLIVTLKADVGARSITGELFSGSLGKIANFEVTATP